MHFIFVGSMFSIVDRIPVEFQGLVKYFIACNVNVLLHMYPRGCDYLRCATKCGTKQNDVLREELRNRQNKANKYIFTAARLIAPVLGETFFEGYDSLIEMLKDQEYLALANEMEMEKAMQHLRRQDFGQV